ncbi:hypothetical protein EVAR_19595_1 [Eumeta japonica]|uniref:Uncharacterized protein n=1 Tax=Eumeta variegata TaxID=151549 RepID=A0A4C1UGR6_EUMVA|nr:hypothetical protein EVAR_19595_1 [Eumeta japonica]
MTFFTLYCRSRARAGSAIAGQGPAGRRGGPSREPPADAITAAIFQHFQGIKPLHSPPTIFYRIGIQKASAAGREGAGGSRSYAITRVADVSRRPARPPRALRPARRPALLTTRDEILIL